MSAQGYDAVVVGGGPAGAAAALRLARAGARVALLERECAAHDKVCGEFLSAEALAGLARLGVDPAALGAVPIGRVTVSRGARRATAALPFAAMSLSRRRLDAALLAAAECAGAHVLRGAAVAALEANGAGWRAATRNGRTIRARSAFLASGKHDVRGWPRRPAGNRLIGLKMHYRPRRRLDGRVEVFLFQGGYGGVEPVEAGCFNLCLLIDSRRFADLGRSWPRLIDALRAGNPVLEACLTGADQLREQPLAVAGVPYGYVHRGSGSGGLFRIGDQMAVIPSITGDGIAIALHTAAMASSGWLRDGPAAASAYHSAARRLLAPQVRRACLLTSLAGLPAVQPGILALCRSWPGLMQRIACATRIADGASYPFLNAAAA